MTKSDSPISVAADRPAKLMSPKEARLRLRYIAELIESVDDRCMWVDGPVTPTLQEMTQAEMSVIYALAKGDPIKVKETAWKAR